MKAFLSNHKRLPFTPHILVNSGNFPVHWVMTQRVTQRAQYFAAWLRKAYDERVRLLVISDTHANFAALEAVLTDAARRRYSRVAHLGDAVGYGGQPKEVIAKLRELGAICIKGNHEQMLLAQADGTAPRPSSIVGEALAWQLSQLSGDEMTWLRKLPDGYEDEEVGAYYRHGTPTSLDEYLNSASVARDVFAQWDGRLGFVGHTHLPAAYMSLKTPKGELVKHQHLTETPSCLIPPSARVILNPGSVGQPRDYRPEASYGIYDATRRHFEVFRVSYNISAAQQAILDAGLPEVLAARLAIGK